MKPPTPLSLVSFTPLQLVVTGALRDGHWIGDTPQRLLYVADNLRDAAAAMWPDALISEPVGMSFSPES